MGASRWEKERSAWLMSHSQPGRPRRRRAEVLRRNARRAERATSGVAETGMHEDVTPPLLRRMLTTDEGPKEQLARLVLIPAALVLIGILIGPALAIAAAIYGVLWYWSPQVGRLWSWPWFAGGVLLFIGGALLIGQLGTGVGVWIEVPSGLHIYPPEFVPFWTWMQTSLALVITGWRIREAGWAAVKPRSGRSKAGVQKNKDGSFKRVADKDLDVLIPYGDDEPVSAPKTPATQADETPVEDLPVFDDEEADLAEDDLEEIELIEIDGDEPQGDVDGTTKKESSNV